MTERFTAQQALEASADGDPIILRHIDVRRICRQHHADVNEFFGTPRIVNQPAATDAGLLFTWLGY